MSRREEASRLNSENIGPVKRIPAIAAEIACVRGLQKTPQTARMAFCDGQRKRGLALRCLAASRQRRRPQMANLANFCNSEKSVKLFRIWWTRGDSNPRPPRCERGALPAELLAHEQQ